MFVSAGARVFLLMTAVFLSACGAMSSSTTPATAHIGQRTKTANCVASGALPDSACTPGSIISTATREQICVSGYARNVRNVTDAEKNQSYAEYDITTHGPGQYEVDHLISLELGGSNDIANLWPEAAEPRPGFHEKDQTENYLHDQVCSGAVALDQAQAQIATNWLDVYNRSVKAH